MWIPGFGTDELRPYKRAPVTEAHKQRMALIRKQMKKFWLLSSKSHHFNNYASTNTIQHIVDFTSTVTLFLCNHYSQLLQQLKPPITRMACNLNSCPVQRGLCCPWKQTASPPPLYPACARWGSQQWGRLESNWSDESGIWGWLEVPNRRTVPCCLLLKLLGLLKLGARLLSLVCFFALFRVGVVRVDEKCCQSRESDRHGVSLEQGNQRSRSGHIMIPKQKRT